MSHTADQFPEHFIFGVGSSAYQVEGAWDQDGKGESSVDRFTHTLPQFMADRSNGDVACDAYHHTAEDVQRLKSLGVDFYRFSISWSRVLPSGDTTCINQAGLDYYNHLIDELLANGIQPMVTMFHFDLPQALEELGGWTNAVLADYFEDYARILYTNFGDRVKWWGTINEPRLYSVFSYGGPIKDCITLAPGKNLHGIGEYLAGHTLLLAHAKAYRLYDKQFRHKQYGKVGIIIDNFGMKRPPGSKDSEEIAHETLTFEAGWFLHPIFSAKGDYPPLLRQRIDHNSQLEGRSRSRLPHFTAQQIDFIKGASDFLGLNHYSTYFVKYGKRGTDPSYFKDIGVVYWPNPETVTVAPNWLAVEPEGLRDSLNWIKSNYGNPPIMITENGCGDRNGINDQGRIEYHKSYLQEILKAINSDGCNILGYSAWSFLDSFEWSSGYTEKFGIYQVDFNDVKRQRTPKTSVEFFRKLFKTRQIPC